MEQQFTFPCLHKRERHGLQGVSTHTVEDAKLVSSSLSFPSRARPHLSRLLLRSGVSVKTLLMEKPGPTGQPSLQQHNHSSVIISAMITIAVTSYLQPVTGLPSCQHLRHILYLVHCLCTQYEGCTTAFGLLVVSVAALWRGSPLVHLLAISNQWLVSWQALLTLMRTQGWCPRA